MTNKPSNIEIGDKFKYRNQTAQVVDIAEVKSTATGDIMYYICFAKCLTGLATNTFEIPFSTVIMNKTK